MEEAVALTEKIKNIFKESMVEYATEKFGDNKIEKAKVIGVLTNFIVMSAFAEDLAGLLEEGTLKVNES